jgi:hypothetical protein
MEAPAGPGIDELEQAGERSGNKDNSGQRFSGPPKMGVPDAIPTQPGTASSCTYWSISLIQRLVSRSNRSARAKWADSIPLAGRQRG